MNTITNRKHQENENYYHVFSKEIALAKLCESSNYPMLQENGQRCYGPPPDWTGPPPEKGCEIFIGGIPRNCYEDELVPIFEGIGKIYTFRLMMDFTGYNRGYAFCLYTNKEASKNAVLKINDYCIRPEKYLYVSLSIDNCRLFVGGIPKDKSSEEILMEMQRITKGVSDVVVLRGNTENSLNRGFAIVEYHTHKEAAMARRKLLPGGVFLWNHQISVNWAEPCSPTNVSSSNLSNSNDVLSPKFSLSSINSSPKRYLIMRNVVNSNEETFKMFIEDKISCYYHLISSPKEMIVETANNANESLVTPLIDDGTSYLNSCNNQASNLFLTYQQISFLNYPPPFQVKNFVQYCIQINKTTYSVYLNTFHNHEEYDVIVKYLNGNIFNGEKIIVSAECSLENYQQPFNHYHSTKLHHRHNHSNNHNNYQAQNLPFTITHGINQNINNHNKNTRNHLNTLVSSPASSISSSSSSSMSSSSDQFLSPTLVGPMTPVNSTTFPIANQYQHVACRINSQNNYQQYNYQNQMLPRGHNTSLRISAKTNQWNRQVNNADNAIMLNKSVQDLSNYCIENNFGQPIFNISINLWIDKLTGLKIPLYHVQIYIPHLNKTFISNDLIEKFDEAITIASTQTLSKIYQTAFETNLDTKENPDIYGNGNEEVAAILRE